jgi:hypothetical protein
VEVAPERFARWIETFAERHGTSITAMTAEITGRGSAAEAVMYRAGDGSLAECHPPFPPLGTRRGSADDPGPQEGARETAPELPGQLSLHLTRQLTEHAARDRTVGVLLVRLGGHAAGVFAGSPPRLLASKTGSRLVHGRNAAGGWSQQRFARRREKQAAGALAAAAGTAAAVFGPYRSRLDAVVLGGDQRAMAAITRDPRLRAELGPYLERAVDRFLTVPEPRLKVLQDTPRLFRAIRIRLTQAPADGSMAAQRAADRRRAPGNTAEAPGQG